MKEAPVSEGRLRLWHLIDAPVSLLSLEAMFVDASIGLRLISHCDLWRPTRLDGEPNVPHGEADWRLLEQSMTAIAAATDARLSSSHRGGIDVTSGNGNNVPEEFRRLREWMEPRPYTYDLERLDRLVAERGAIRFGDGATVFVGSERGSWARPACTYFELRDSITIERWDAVLFGIQADVGDNV